MIAGAGISPRAVLLSLEDVLLPRQTLARWQWAWRPQGPRLSERHVRPAIKRAVHEWDRRRWEALVGGQEALPPGDYRSFLRETLTGIAGHALPEAETEAVVDRFPRYPDEAGPFADVTPFLRRVALGETPVAVLANRPGPETREAIRRAGLAGMLPTVLGEGESDPRPPFPAAFRGAAKQLGCRASEALFVGTLFWSEVRASARAGLDAVLIDRHDWWGRVQAPRIHSLTELTGRFPDGPGAPVAPAPAPPPAP